MTPWRGRTIPSHSSLFVSGGEACSAYALRLYMAASFSSPSRRRIAMSGMMRLLYGRFEKIPRTTEMSIPAWNSTDPHQLSVRCMVAPQPSASRKVNARKINGCVK